MSGRDHRRDSGGQLTRAGGPRDREALVFAGVIGVTALVVLVALLAAIG